MRAGGSAADAAVAASAVLAVTTQHMCGLGGDLFALVHDPATSATACLNASGRAGSGADPDRLRSEGHASMPFKGDVRSVTVPGCVDGWLELHGRFGRLPLADVLLPAIQLAAGGFPASPLLAASAPRIADVDGADEFRTDPPLRTGDLVRRPGVARSLAAIVADGRTGFYGGEFGTGLIELGAGEFTPDDLATSQADWVAPLSAEVWGHTVHTVPPSSQGYLSLAGALIAVGLDLPDDDDDPRWAHLLIESARQAAWDRPGVLHEGADGNALVEPGRLAARRRAIDTDAAAELPDTYRGGGTIYLCAVDADRMGVSLIQSNASGFGAHLVVPGTGIHLHNRGTGFSLRPGHPAEYGPRRRPPHTLSPALVTHPDGRLRSVLGTMGGDAQPQVVLQLLTRLLRDGDDAGRCISAPRWILTSPHATGFDTWTTTDGPIVSVEPHAPTGWDDGLRQRGHTVRRAADNYGLAHLIEVVGPVLAGASDPRARTGAAAGY